jgi:hypothetical protein
MARVVHGKRCPWREFSMERVIQEWVVHGASCPWSEFSIERVVHGASCPWDEMSLGRVVHSVSCPMDELSMWWVAHGRVFHGTSSLVMGWVVMGGGYYEESCHGSDVRWVVHGVSSYGANCHGAGCHAASWTRVSCQRRKILGWESSQKRCIFVNFPIHCRKYKLKCIAFLTVVQKLSIFNVRSQSNNQKRHKTQHIYLSHLKKDVPQYFIWDSCDLVFFLEYVYFWISVVFSAPNPGSWRLI